MSQILTNVQPDERLPHRIKDAAVIAGLSRRASHGLTDLFGIAAGIASDQRRESRAALRVTHWQPAHSRDAKLSCVYDSDPRVSPQPRILIIPPTMMDLPDPDVPAGVVSWLCSRHEDGAKLVAVCSGAFILAAWRCRQGGNGSLYSFRSSRKGSALFLWLCS
jgi:transcriptional regulator GlxA family with amidase domain